MSSYRTIFLSISIFTFLSEVRATKLDGHHHHHDGHHHDHSHAHHDHDHNHGTKDSNFVLNEDIFAKALAAEVHHGLFSPLPKLSNTGPQSSNSLRGVAKFRTPLDRTTDLSSRKGTSEKSLISGSNQEIPTPVTAQQNSQLSSGANRPPNQLRSINNSLRRTTIRGVTQSPTEQPTTYNDDTGFAPRAPPKTAKQFNPFTANQNAVQQQMSKFQFRSPKKVTDNTGFAPRAPPATAKQFNPVPTKKANSFQFARSGSSAKSVVDTTGFAPVSPPPTAKQFNPFAGSVSDTPGFTPAAHSLTAKHSNPAPAVSDTTGFAPVAPPPTAKQFNPVPGASDDWSALTTLTFDQDSTTALSTDYFSTNYDTDYDYEGNANDYDQNTLDVGKSLQDSFQGVNQGTENSATFDYPTQADALLHSDASLGKTASDPRSQQINVLGALSSSGNVLNSPKYNSNTVHDDVTDENHSEAHFSGTTLRSTFVKSDFHVVTGRNSIELDDTLGINSKEIGSNILAFESGNNLGRNIPATGGGGVPLPSLASSGAASPTPANAEEATLTSPTSDGATLSSRTSGVAALSIGRTSRTEVQPNQVGNALQSFDNTDAGTADNKILGRQLGAGSEGDQDYPQYATVPPTSFRCEDQQYSGYYADPDTQCQAFHICLHSKNLGSFLCPNGTLFHQQLFVCDWWYNVRCDEASLSYDLNKLIGAQDQVLLETRAVEGGTL